MHYVIDHGSVDYFFCWRNIDGEESTLEVKHTNGFSKAIDELADILEEEFNAIFLYLDDSNSNPMGLEATMRDEDGNEFIVSINQD